MIRMLTKAAKVLNVEAVNVLKNRIQRQTSVSSSSSLRVWILRGADTEDVQRADLRGHRKITKEQGRNDTGRDSGQQDDVVDQML